MKTSKELFAEAQQMRELELFDGVAVLDELYLFEITRPGTGFALNDRATKAMSTAIRARWPEIFAEARAAMVKGN